MTDPTRDNTRLTEEERKRVFEGFNAKRNNATHDLWEAQKYRSTLNSKQTTGLFDEWVGAGSGPYENDVKTLGYQGPQLTAQYLAKYIPKNRDQSKVLDVGAGSGLSGTELKRVGFTNVDWLDPSENSIPPAKKTNAYSRFINEYLTAKPLDVAPDTYDAITCVGAFFEGCLPIECFTEMIRIVKPGGYIVMSISCTSLETCKEYNGRLEPRILELAEAKEWELVEKTKEPEYLINVPAIFFVLRVLRSG
ncbi:hypothetical protein SNE40_007166 [Patella caerulea]|uniref:Methyltransferase type 11 domain-containing protein n=1 Tax=Patella caerulea TaxID=87958 RepID=A0AAN8PTD4_PATCE